mgnify:CR=1 FL=1
MATPDLLMRCSSLGKIMTDPAAAAAKAGEVLSVGAKTHIRSLASQFIFGVEFEVSSKQMEKGIKLEDAAIAMVGRVRGLELSKNKERRSNGYLTGEADVFHQPTRAGRDTKVPWSVATFPITVEDCIDKDYLWQMRGYMMLWDAERWHVDYVLLDTPEELIGYEPQSMHFVSHIPEHLRVTTWTVERDRALEPVITERVRAAREYMRQVIAEFDRTHQASGVLPAAAEPPPWEDAKPAAPQPTTKPAQAPAFALPDF